MENERAADILEQAADLLESEKVEWCQHNYAEHELCDAPIRLVCPVHKVKGIHYTDEVISACAVGALLVVTGMSTETYFMGVNEVADLVNIISLNQWGDEDPDLEVESWNDQEGRTKDEVIDLFKNSAKRFRNGELTCP